MSDNETKMPLQPVREIPTGEEITGIRTADWAEDL